MSSSSNKLLRVPISCPTCKTRTTCEWCELDDDGLSLLDSSKVTNIYRPGQMIFYEGNPCLGVYCIQEGTIALRKTNRNGSSVILRVVEAGATLGYRAYFAGSEYHASAEVLSAARVCFIDRDTLSVLLGGNPRVGMRFLSHLATDLGQAEGERFQLATLSVRPRLAQLLLSLKERHATVDDNGNIVFDLPFSRRELAEHLGARPETVARTIKKMHNDSVAQFDGRRVHVSDLDRLLDEVDFAV
ncbi:MAG: Crp/Fnr family transcriptional regulator [Myxococcota bacterium]